MGFINCFEGVLMSRGHIKKNLISMTAFVAAGLFFLIQNHFVYGAVYEYDSLGRVTGVVYEDGKSVTYTYDSNGNMTGTISTVQGEKPFEEEPADEGQTKEQPGGGQANGAPSDGGHADGVQSDSGQTDEVPPEEDFPAGSPTEDAPAGNRAESGDAAAFEKDGAGAPMESTGQEADISGTDNEDSKENSSARRWVLAALTAGGIAAVFLYCRKRAKRKGLRKSRAPEQETEKQD